MIPLANVDSAVMKYSAERRKSSYSSPLRISAEYSLFPDEPGSETATHKWPENFPNPDAAGVYLIFSMQRSLLYIGSTTRRLNRRLADYFGYFSGRSGPCKIKDMAPPWKTRPCFVRTIAVTNPSEAPDLEGYLIDALQPPDNTRGVYRR